MTMSWLPLLVMMSLAPVVDVAAQGRSGRQAYEAACATCHGVDGRGVAAAESDYPLAVPDFTDCNFAAREPDSDWLAISHDGGPARGFSRLMPAFGEAVAREELERALAYIRGFCASDAWPRGELNLPRALVTTKAYPEDEAVVTVSAARGAVTNKFVYERRFGPRNQVEMIVPLAFSERRPGDWTGGVGDLAFAFKRALAHSLRRGSILSGAIELVMPTGSTERGVGGGTTVVEPFFAFGQILPADTFMQFQVGGEIPLGSGHADEAFWRTVIGKQFTRGDFGRTWSPMVEILGARALASGQKAHWDFVPQVQVTLSTRQHIMANAGVRIPVNERQGRSTQTIVYLLWDWFDGGFLTGW
jgi:mono/diheme cytochrome c family protein